MQTTTFSRKIVALFMAIVFLMGSSTVVFADDHGKSYQGATRYHGDRRGNDRHDNTYNSRHGGPYEGDHHGYHNQHRGGSRDSYHHGYYRTKSYRNVWIPGSVSAHARRLAVRYGYTGYRGLPPGLHKKVLIGRPLPPGYAVRPVPVLVLNQLPRHHGYEWRRCGNDLVLLTVGTAIVATVLFGVFR